MFGFEPSEELRMELVAFGRRRLGGLAPKEIDFDPHLPHTRSGKVMRRNLVPSSAPSISAAS